MLCPWQTEMKELSYNYLSTWIFSTGILMYIVIGDRGNTFKMLEQKAMDKRMSKIILGINQEDAADYSLQF